MKYRNLARKYGAKVSAAGVVFVSTVGVAHADPAAAFTALTTKVTELEGLAWPVVTTVFVALAAIGLFKKFAGKSVR